MGAIKYPLVENQIFKVCPCCGKSKPRTEEMFGLRSRYKKTDYERYLKDFNSYCRKCRSEKAKNPGAEWYAKNKEHKNQKHKEWYQKNKESRMNKIAEWRENNKDKVKQLRSRWERFQRKTSIKKCISERISAGIRGSLCNGGKNRRSWESILGFTSQQLIEHLEAQFKDGMSWENRELWHIDHIRPIASFKFESIEDDDFKKCWALDNLQPLWAKDNIIKRDHWIGDLEGLV